MVKIHGEVVGWGPSMGRNLEFNIVESAGLFKSGGLIKIRFDDKATDDIKAALGLKGVIGTEKLFRKAKEIVIKIKTVK
jgi:hypothetical protein